MINLDLLGEIAGFRARLGTVKADLSAVSIKITASGAVANLVGNLGIPFTAFTAAIDYDADGWSGMTLTGCGKNLLNSASAELKAVDASDNQRYVVTFTKSGTYHIITDSSTQVYFKIVAKDLSSYGTPTPVTTTDQTVTVDSTHMLYLYAYSATLLANVCVSFESTAYEAYDGDTVTVDFGETIYGGSLDVLTGVLTSTLAADGTELAEAVTYQLTPPDLADLLDKLNVWADTGDVTVQYYEDTKTYIDNAIAAAVAALS